MTNYYTIMARQNFEPDVRDQIEAAAGHQCSFPSCNRRTSGIGPDSEYISKSGYGCHIYSAASRGPRGQGGLSPDELKSATNGIWMCGVHAKLIDNKRGKAYPPELLLSYKALHEARVSLEHEGLYSPIGWLHEFTISSSFLFSTPQTFQLAKLNLIYGGNATGKTAIVEWISGFFDSQNLERWMSTQHEPLEVKLSLLTPKLQNLSLKVDGANIYYWIDGTPAAFVPIAFRVIKPDKLDFSVPDDLEMLSCAFHMPPTAIKALLDEVHKFPHARVSKLRFVIDDESGRTSLRSDLHGTAPGLCLRQLSHRESERVIVELATAAARLSGSYCPTLLVLDGVVSLIFDGFFDFYSHHLLDPINRFQTVMSLAEQDLDLAKLEWNGWQVVRTEGKPPNVMLVQSTFSG